MIKSLKEEFSNLQILTIGYGNRKIETFLELLNKHHVKCLVDVRTSPFSRFNPAFRRNLLTAHLTDHEIDYVFLGDCLGGKPNDPSLYMDKQLNYEAVKRMDSFNIGIQKLLSIASLKITAIMCSELKPEMCHRKTLIGDYLAQNGISVHHINEAGLLTNKLF